MDKGKIEAFCMAILDSDTRLVNSLEALSAVLTKTLKESEPLTTEETSTILGIVNVALGLTRSNQAQLKGMLQEAHEKGV